MIRECYKLPKTMIGADHRTDGVLVGADCGAATIWSRQFWYMN